MSSILAVILVHVLTALLAIPLRRGVGCRLLSILASLIGLLGAFDIVAAVQREGVISYSVGDWGMVGIVLAADYLSAIMLLLASIVIFVVSIYATYGAPPSYHRNYFYTFFHFMSFAVMGAFLAGDLFNLYVMFEVMLISSFALMVIGGERAHYSGAIRYMLINLVASTVFITAAALFYSHLGTLNMAEIALRISQLADKSVLFAPALLLISAFCIKAGLVPFHFWLPASYVNLLSVNGGLHAGLLTKVGVYALIRSFTLFFPDFDPFFFDYLLLLSVVSMIIGVIGAVSSFSVRRILSFHIISQIGYMTLALSFSSATAIAAALFYTCYNMLAKTNLFLVSGVVEKYYGDDDLARTGGAFHWSKTLSFTFIISGLALGGIPPLPGFFAKFLVIKSALMNQHLIAALVAIAVGIFSLFSMMKIWAEVFLKRVPEGVEVRPLMKSEERVMVGSTVIMAVLVLAMGLGSGVLYKFCKNAALQLKNPALYINGITEGVK